MNKTITSFDDLFDASVDPDRIISSFISGHLMIEFMLVKIIEKISPMHLDLAKGLSHYKLIILAKELDLITDSQTEVLIKINKIRNNFAHNIAFRLTIDEIKQLFTIAKQSFSDMTDGLEQGIEELEGKTKITEYELYILSELFIQIVYDLSDIYEVHGGDINEFNKKKH